MKHVATGELVEVGQLLDALGAQWPAIAIKVDGHTTDQTVIYIPVTWAEAKNMGASLYDRVSITIETAVPETEADA